MGVRRLDVDVNATFSSSGRIEPKAIFLYKTQCWIPVVEILNIDRAANLKVGGRGMRYRVVTLEGELEGEPLRRNRTLWCEGNKWFVEESV